jgi:hypothetical protein
MQTLRNSRLIMQFAHALATTVKMTAVVSVIVPHTIDIAYADKHDSADGAGGSDDDHSK